LQPQPPLLGGSLRDRPARRLVRGGGEASVAATAVPAPRDDDFVPGHCEIGEPFAGLGVENQGAGRNARDDVFAAPPVLGFAAAMLAAHGRDAILKLEVEQRRDPAVGPQDHAAAVATVAARWTAVGAILL